GRSTKRAAGTALSAAEAGAADSGAAAEAATGVVVAKLSRSLNDRAPDNRGPFSLLYAIRYAKRISAPLAQRADAWPDVYQVGQRSRPFHRSPDDRRPGRQSGQRPKADQQNAAIE